MEQIKREIREYVTSSYSHSHDELGDEDSLMELGILDSLGLLQLVSFVEDKFSIHVGHELSPENLDSISRITAFVTRKRTDSASLADPQNQAPEMSSTICPE